MILIIYFLYGLISFFIYFFLIFFDLIFFLFSFGAKTMGASMAQSRLKTIEKLETSGIEAPKVQKQSMKCFY